MSRRIDASDATILDALLASLEKACEYNSGSIAAPAAILWTDEARHWERLIPLIRPRLPALLELGAYNPAEARGPAIWLRAMLARELDAAEWAEDVVPVIYLPGVSRQMLRAVDTCPPEIQPLAELQHRGAFWTQVSARDWTPSAFLMSSSGLGLDLAKDHATKDALQRALVVLAGSSVRSLQGRELTSADFDKLLLPDPSRDLLRWMSEPESVQKEWPGERWEAFCAICREIYGFGPTTDGTLSAAEHLAEGAGAWAQIWTRFQESPNLYPGIRALLEKAHPSTLIYNPSSWPRCTTDAEESLRQDLLTLTRLSPNEAVTRVLQLEDEHGVRRDWAWAKLQMAPLAGAMEHLAILAGVCRNALGGTSPDHMGELYRNGAWKADEAAMNALAAIQRLDLQVCIHTALQAIYSPWLSDAAEHLQALVRAHGYPGERDEFVAPVTAVEGECIFFADGLRYDVGERLREQLLARGHSLELGYRWTALPSVTATSKPSVSPISESVSGFDFNEDFLPCDASDQKSLTTDRFRRLLSANGYQVLRGDDVGNPRERAWAEHGDLDTIGHDDGWKLARRIDEQVQEIVVRIEALLTAGWQSIKLVTDHGWLLLPGGLPKVELPKYLTDTRWSRCAMLKTSTQAESLLVVDWRWDKSVRIALAPGIGAFKAGLEYSHGGLSLQECLTPTLQITGGACETTAAITDVRWRGLRCQVSLEGFISDMKVDIRLKPADASSSVAGSLKSPDSEGTVSLLVPDDDLLDTAAHIVVLDSSGKVLARKTTCIGGGD